MRLEDRVCSPELSKKLKELGVKQESLYFWLVFVKEHYPFNLGHTELLPEYMAQERFAQKIEDGEVLKCSAFTVAELVSEITKHGYQCRINSEDVVLFLHEPELFDSHKSIADNLADAFASLIEKGIVKP